MYANLYSIYYVGFYDFLPLFMMIYNIFISKDFNYKMYKLFITLFYNYRFILSILIFKWMNFNIRQNLKLIFYIHLKKGISFWIYG